MGCPDSRGRRQSEEIVIQCGLRPRESRGRGMLGADHLPLRVFHIWGVRPAVRGRTRSDRDS